MIALEYSKWENFHKVIKSAMVAANKEVNTAWLNSYEKVIKISEN